MTKSQKKERINSILRKLEAVTENTQIPMIFEEAINEINETPFLKSHIDVIEKTIELTRENSVNLLLEYWGREMPAKDKEMLSFNLGQLRNTIDSSLLPDN